MSSEAQRNVDVFERWLDEVAANGNRAAEIGFISPTFTMHSDAGEQRISRDEWPRLAGRGKPRGEPRRVRAPRRRRTTGNAWVGHEGDRLPGNRAMLRWSYSYPDSTAAQPSRLSG